MGKPKDTTPKPAKPAKQSKCANGHLANTEGCCSKKGCAFNIALKNAPVGTCTECWALNGKHTNICSQG
jgi:hypothetical protein